MEIEKQVCTLKQSGTIESYGVRMKKAQYCWVAFSVPSGQEFVLCRPASSIEEMAEEWAWYIVGNHSEEIRKVLDEGELNADGAVYNAFTVSELGAMIGKGTQASENFWQWLIDCVNSGLSGTVAFNPVTLAGFIITQLENGVLTAEEINKRLSSN